MFPASLASGNGSASGAVAVQQRKGFILQVQAWQLYCFAARDHAIHPNC